MKVPLMHTTSHLIECPVCNDSIVAEVQVKVSLTAKPREGNVVPVDAETTMERFNVRHDCRGRIEAEAFVSTDEESQR